MRYSKDEGWGMEDGASRGPDHGHDGKLARLFHRHHHPRMAADESGAGHGRGGRHGGWFGHGRGGRHGLGGDGLGNGDGFGRGRGRGGSGRMFGPGDLRLVLLSLIGEQPRHGYELIKAVEELFGGAYAPSPGSVYPILTLLEEIGQIRAAASDGAKRLFEITDEGRAVLATNKAVIDAIMSRMGLVANSMAGTRPPEEVHQAFQTLKAAVLLNRRGWGSEEVARVRSIIETAAQEIALGKKGG